MNTLNQDNVMSFHISIKLKKRMSLENRKYYKYCKHMINIYKIYHITLTVL